MHCPVCGEPDSRVIDSRVADGGSGVRRRRECTRCLKRFTTYERIEKEIRDEGYDEVSSARIGEKVMEKLKELDQIAYVRFASVYREFRDVDQFMEILSSLKKNEKA